MAGRETSPRLDTETGSQTGAYEIDSQSPAFELRLTKFITSLDGGKCTRNNAK